MSEERRRLEEDRLGQNDWRRWGPYLSERQWGSVREDYSADGRAWDYFPHIMAPARAYRWGEDGLAGFSDDNQHICLALALWNGRDPLLKERLFGLTNSEGNHGEDVKELYYYLDATPTHSYLKMLYKYPQREFPYAALVHENRQRGREVGEFELLDTGIFDDDRYFDVFIEYAKASPNDILMQVTAINRGPEPGRLHILPHVWFRNTWTWHEGAVRPELHFNSAGIVHLNHPKMGAYTLQIEVGPESPPWLFTENETNSPRLFGVQGVTGFYKDAFHDYLIRNQQQAINPQRKGTKAAAWVARLIPPGASARVRLRLTEGTAPKRFGEFDGLLARRKQEADEFYAELQAEVASEDARLVQRQALAGMIWSKQVYHYDVHRWLTGDPTQPPPPPARLSGRNSDWTHLRGTDVLSMPDKWEYPWFAAWDHAFHAVAFARLDPEFAKKQLLLLTREWYMNPNGQLPAYEWAFGDVNPPVHAWATWRVFQIDRRQRGVGDLAFLERVFHKLLLCFTWWVNRKDAWGRNLFQGGFLGLDNIGVFDRSAPLPMGGHLIQADATSWMAMFSLNLMRIALELALHNPVYQDIATKFFEHFLQIADAMMRMGDRENGLWDEEDEFYYDQLQQPNGQGGALKVRSIVGLIPLFAVETVEPECLERVPDFRSRLEWFLAHRRDLCQLVSRWREPGRGERRLLSLLRGHRMKCLLRRMLDPAEFLSDFGVRALSRYHLDHPYTLWVNGQPLTVRYQSAESDSGMFGGNSNWRGPIWIPLNYLIIESLQKFHHYYGDDFKVECPTGSGQFLTLAGVANDLSGRLQKLFLRDANGSRPMLGPSAKVQQDVHFQDLLVFPEYFDGDTGRGLGAMHQTGWTGLIAKLIQPRRPEDGCCPPLAPAKPGSVRPDSGEIPEDAPAV